MRCTFFDLLRQYKKSDRIYLSKGGLDDVTRHSRFRFNDCGKCHCTKKFLERKIHLLPKGSVVMYKNQKHPVPYWHQYQDGKIVATQITGEQARVLASQIQARRCLLQELHLAEGFLKSAYKQIQQAYTEQQRRSQCKMPILPVVQSENPYREEDRIHISVRKEKMRSRAEILVSDALIAAGLNYRYEKELVINGKRYYPDFTVTCPLFPYAINIEYCGFDFAEYVRWQHQKIIEYEKGGILQGVNLLIIWESDGLLDAAHIRNLIKTQLTMERYQTVAQWLSNQNQPHT